MKVRLIQRIVSLFKKQSVVIFGNSISTYHGGWIPDQYDCFYEVEDASRFFGLSDVSDCWWYMVYDQLRKSHRKIVSVINVSYSGSRVTGNKFPSGQSYRRVPGSMP